jgi:hypothetical protein
VTDPALVLALGARFADTADVIVLVLPDIAVDALYCAFEAVLAGRARHAVCCAPCCMLANAACCAFLRVVRCAVGAGGTVVALAGRQPARPRRRQAHCIHIVGEVDDECIAGAAADTRTALRGAAAAAAQVLRAAAAGVAAISEAVGGRPSGGEVCRTDPAVLAGSARRGRARCWHGRWPGGRIWRWRSAGRCRRRGGREWRWRCGRRSGRHVVALRRAAFTSSPLPTRARQAGCCSIADTVNAPERCYPDPIRARIGTAAAIAVFLVELISRPVATDGRPELDHC